MNFTTGPLSTQTRPAPIPIPDYNMQDDQDEQEQPPSFFQNQAVFQAGVQQQAFGDVPMMNSAHVNFEPNMNSMSMTDSPMMNNHPVAMGQHVNPQHLFQYQQPQPFTFNTMQPKQLYRNRSYATSESSFNTAPSNKSFLTYQKSLLGREIGQKRTLSNIEGDSIDATCSSFNSSINGKYIKRLCIREEKEEGYDHEFDQKSDECVVEHKEEEQPYPMKLSIGAYAKEKEDGYIETEGYGDESEGYASEFASSTTGLSDCATTDSTSFIPLQGIQQRQGVEPQQSYELKRNFLRKRPRSFLSVDATAGSANTRLSSVGSSDVEFGSLYQNPMNPKVGIEINNDMIHQRPLKRLSTVSIEEMERAETQEEEERNAGQDIMQQQKLLEESHTHQEDIDQMGDEDVHENEGMDAVDTYKPFNSMLGSLHLERERRAKEMNNLLMQKRKSLTLANNQATSGSMSSLTTFSTTTGGNQQNSRWKIPKQVHLQSHSNLG